MRKVHLIHKMSYNAQRDEFKIYDTEVYSNQTTRDWFANQIVSVNEGHSVKREDIGDNGELITYMAKSTEGTYFKHRLHLLSKPLQ